jgi:hypothetical protein
MAVTAAGTPYVESSDNVADYPGVSLALANHIDGLDGGKVLQVVSVTKVDAFTTTSVSFADITGLTASITPSAVSSKILVLYKVSVNPRAADAVWLQLLRGATVIGGGTAVGLRPSAMSGFYTGGALGTVDLTGNFLDSPASTSSQAYKIQTRVTAGTLGINTSLDDPNSSTRDRMSSTITLMEISA